ncbi:inositol monophosphatase [Candidatus Daviesbacteria bacterium]|nr:inositol monophosphatase [Candidatus Daviesbacteria bacterium]
MKELQPTVKFIEQITRKAGRILLKHQGSIVKVADRGSGDYTTQADLASENYLVTAVKRRFPDHQILTEEEGIKEVSLQKPCWIIDPLDGTRNFTFGIPLWVVSVAFYDQGEGQIGAIFCPRLNEFFLAQKGQGATLNGQPIHVSQKSTLDQAFLVTNYFYSPEAAGKNTAWLNSLSGRILAASILNCSLLEICYIAAGRFDAGLYRGGKPWDWAAVKVIMEEAGGVMTKLDGKAADIFYPDHLFNNGVLHSAILATKP